MSIFACVILITFTLQQPHREEVPNPANDFNIADVIMDFGEEEVVTFSIQPGATEVLKETIVALPGSNCTIRGFYVTISNDNAISFSIKEVEKWQNVLFQTVNTTLRARFNLENVPSSRYGYIFHNTHNTKAITVIFAIKYGNVQKAVLNATKDVVEVLSDNDITPVNNRILNLYNNMKSFISHGMIMSMLSSNQFQRNNVTRIAVISQEN